jgi:hypothetical protein
MEYPKDEHQLPSPSFFSFSRVEVFSSMAGIFFENGQDLLERVKLAHLSYLYLTHLRPSTLRGYG